MIRKAKQSDFESILNLAAEFWLQTDYDEVFERDHTLVMVKMAFDHGLLAVVEINDEVVGFCAGVKSFILASSKAMIATELAYWVDPQHRGGKNGIALLHFMEELVKEQKIKYWTMIAMQSSMPEQVGRLYENMGYVRSETGYTKVFDYGCSNSSGSSGSSRGSVLSAL